MAGKRQIRHADRALVGFYCDKGKGRERERERQRYRERKGRREKRDTGSVFIF